MQETIRRYSGGLNGDGIRATLVKVDGEWFVTSLDMVYVSWRFGAVMD